MVNVFLLLCIASQSLAAPLHLMGPADLANLQSIEAECPAHQDATAEAGNPESCECSGGACCKARTDRLPSLTVTNIESISADGQNTRIAESTVPFESCRFISSVQSRAPPFTSVI
jgi:hypothetical protein